MKMLNLINERASDVVFHGTRAKYAYKILKDDQFQLTLVEPNTSDDHNDSRGNVYYLSTARSTTSRYFVAVDVLFKLDGAKLSHRYKAKAFNYFNGDKFNWFEDEMEDRVINTDPTIDNASKYIMEVHMYMIGSRRGGTISDIRRKIVLLCKKMGIPYYLYPTNERSSFFALNTKNSVSLSYFDYKNKKGSNHRFWSETGLEDDSKKVMMARGLTYLYRAPYSERTLPDYAQYVLDILRTLPLDIIRRTVKDLKFTRSRLGGSLVRYIKKEGSYNDFKNFLIDKWKVKRNFPN